MLSKLKSFFQERVSTESAGDSESRLQLAAAALMVELSKADFEQDSQEYQRIHQLLQSHFGADNNSLSEIIALAEEEFDRHNALYPFTRLINEEFSDEQKYQLMEALWHVAAADGKISKHEDHLIRKIADLTYVPHSVFIRAKVKVMEQLENQ